MQGFDGFGLWGVGGVRSVKAIAPMVCACQTHTSVMIYVCALIMILHDAANVTISQFELGNDADQTA